MCSCHLARLVPSNENLTEGWLTARELAKCAFELLKYTCGIPADGSRTSRSIILLFFCQMQRSRAMSAKYAIEHVRKLKKLSADSP